MMGQYEFSHFLPLWDMDNGEGSFIQRMNVH